MSVSTDGIAGHFDEGKEIMYYLLLFPLYKGKINFLIPNDESICICGITFSISGVSLEKFPSHWKSCWDSSLKYPRPYLPWGKGWFMPNLSFFTIPLLSQWLSCLFYAFNLRVTNRAIRQTVVPGDRSASLHAG